MLILAYYLKHQVFKINCKNEFFISLTMFFIFLIFTPFFLISNCQQFVAYCSEFACKSLQSCFSVSSIKANKNYFMVEPAKETNEYVTLKLNKPPVNTFNLEMFELINKQLEEFEINESLKGVILTSVNKSKLTMKSNQ